tara:strand:- start:345 stop:536 length:192 start_codon:yes stop_codon:yes gene_type:complete
MTQYIAKPNMNTDTDMKTFNIESDAIKYLEEYTGYEMSYERNRKTGEKTSDWYLIEKLIKIDE